MFRAVFFVFGFLIAAGLNAQQGPDKNITITGALIGDQKGFNKVFYYGKNVPDSSVSMVNGKFKITFPFKEPGFVILYTEYDRKIKHSYEPFGLLIDRPGTLVVGETKIENAFKDATVSGMVSATGYNNFSLERRHTYKQAVDVAKNQYGIDEQDTAKSSRHIIDSIYKRQMSPRVTALVKKYSQSIASSYLLESAISLLTLSELESNYKLISPAIQKSGPGTFVGSYITGKKLSSIGSTVADFTLSDPNNLPVSLSQLKGKYIVLDFWASWCGPCRASFPHMKEIYGKYRDKNLEFVGISIDSDKASWLTAVKMENNPWPQLLDTKNVHTGYFGILNIPTTIMIDPEGKIMLKEVGLKADGTGLIENKLKSLFTN